MHTLSLGVDGNLLNLGSYPSYSPPVKSTAYKQSFTSADIVEDIIIVSIQSSVPGDLLAFISEVDEVINRVNLFQSRPVVSQSYVIYRQNQSDPSYKSFIISLFYEPLGPSIEEITKGSLLIKLHLTRPNYWVGPSTALPLSNGNGSRVITPLSIINHDDTDSSHDNFVTVNPADFSTDLPCPINLKITNTSSSDTLRHLYLFMNVFSNPTGPPGLLEAEAGTGGTTTASAQCSGGSYKALSWAVTTETLLLTWLINSASSAAFNKNNIKFILRLANVFSYTNLWLKLKFACPSASSFIGETDWILGKPGEILQEFPPIQLPPYSSRNTVFNSPFYLSLNARRTTAGTHNLDVDFLHGYAIDGFSKLEALNPISPNAYFYLNSYSDLRSLQPELITVSSSMFFDSHILYGGKLLLYPGQYARLSFLHDISSGLAPIDRTCSVQAWYASLKRFV
jgi:hypothetical protein